MTALCYAAKLGNESTCRSLVEAGSDVNLPRNDGRCALKVLDVFIALNPNHILLQDGADVRRGERSCFSL